MVQLANYQWQASPSATSKRYYDSSLPQSPLALYERTSSRNAVPSGLVASRVLLLQKTTSGKSDIHSKQSPSITVQCDRGSSRTAFGRRMTNRFGQPAVQNTKPDEETTAVDAYHTFAGLNTPRGNHNQHHAVVEPQLRMVRSSTQIQLLAQPQDNGATPTGKALGKSKSHNPIRQHYNSLDIDVLQEIDPSGKKTTINAQTSIFPLPPSSSDSDLFREGIKSRSIHTMTSENSFATTSSIRRQSVRDLFADYGIDRPAGLISNHTSRQAECSSQPEEFLGKCHLCGWNNGESCSSCWRCGHNSYLTYDNRPKISDQSLPIRDGYPAMKIFEISKPTLLPVTRRFVEEEPVKQLKSVTACQDVSNISTAMLIRKRPSITSRFVDAAMKRETSDNTSHPKQSLRKQSSCLSLLTGAKTTSKVKESPFLLADLQAFRRCLRQAPIDSSCGQRVTLESRPNRDNSDAGFQTRFSCSEGGIDGDPRLSRVSPHQTSNPSQLITPLLRQDRSIHEETDNGYVADTSIFDDLSELERPVAFQRHHFQSMTRSKIDTSLSTNTTLIEGSSQPQSLLQFINMRDSVEPHSGSASLRPTRPSLQLWRGVDIFQDSQLPEFAECRGYPRTGHIRHHVSPVDAGTIGTCQHCLEDCRCAACQSTDHSVRCCTNADHQSMFHFHPTSQREVSPQDANSFTTSLLKKASSQPESPPTSPRTSVAAPTTLQKTHSLLQHGTNPFFSESPFHRHKMSLQGKEKSITDMRTRNSIAMRTRHSSCSVVETALKIGQIKPVASITSKETDQKNLNNASITSQFFPVSTRLQNFTQPSSKCISSNTTSIAATNGSFFHILSEPTAANMTEERTRPSLQDGEESRVEGLHYEDRGLIIDSGNGLGMTSTTLSDSIQPTESTVLTNNNHFSDKNQLVAQQTIKSTHSLHNLVTQENIQPATPSAVVVRTTTSHRGDDGAVAERKFKLKLVNTDVTPIDGNAEIAPRTPMYGRCEGLSTNSCGTAERSTGDDTDFTEEHHCLWRSKYVKSLADRRHGQGLGQQGGVDININAITVVLYLEGRDDLVVRAESWQGGALSAGGQS